MSQIFKSMSAILGDLVAIEKGKTNASQGFKYRGIDDVYNALHPLLAKHKVFCTPEVLEKSRDERTNQKGTVLAFTCLRVKYTFWAEDGSSVSCTVEGEGMDSGDKSSNKAMAIAHKYAFLQTFCIPTEDLIDPDAEVHQVTAPKAPTARKGDDKGATKVSAEQAANLQALAEEVGVDMPKFLGWLKVKTIEDVAQFDYLPAVAALEAKRAKQ